MTLELPKIPKIPMNLSGDKKITWVEIDEAICRGRILMLFEELNSKVLADSIALFLFFNGEDQYEDIFVFINSRGGDLRAGITLYDMMVALQPDVYTSVLGLAASTASLILCGGTERAGFPHARVMIQQPVIPSFSGPIETLASKIDEIIRLRNIMAKIYSKKTGKAVSVIEQDFQRMKYMSVTEAKEYGIIDKVITEAVLKRYKY